MTDRAVFSVDLELFTHTPAYRGAAGETSEADVGLDAVDGLLELLDDRAASATFFVVSSLADRHPDVVRSIADAGHEVASHTHTHPFLSSMSPDGECLREEYERSRRTLERVSGRSVTGFRAPAFDVPTGHFDHLAAAGYRYDSSVVPCRRIPGWYGGEHDVHRPAPASRLRPDASPDITELPVSVMPRVRLPLSGAWLRFFGSMYTVAGMARLARQGITPVLYVHPWELVDLPAVDGVPRRVYWRTGAWTRRALERILEEPFEFVTARTAVEGADRTGGGAPAVSGERTNDPHPSGDDTAGTGTRSGGRDVANAVACEDLDGCTGPEDG